MEGTSFKYQISCDSILDKSDLLGVNRRHSVRESVELEGGWVVGEDPGRVLLQLQRTGVFFAFPLDILKNFESSI